MLNIYVSARGHANAWDTNTVELVITYLVGLYNLAHYIRDMSHPNTNQYGRASNGQYIGVHYDQVHYIKVLPYQGNREADSSYICPSNSAQTWSPKQLRPMNKWIIFRWMDYSRANVLFSRWMNEPTDWCIHGEAYSQINYHGKCILTESLPNGREFVAHQFQGILCKSRLLSQVTGHKLPITGRKAVLRRTCL